MITCFFCHVEKHRKVDITILGVRIQTCPQVPKIRRLHIFAISPEEHRG